MNKKCSKCNTENPLHAKYCRRCGKRFDEEPEIADFRLNAVCRVGDVVDFSWNVVNADKVTLNGMVVTGKTHIPVTIKGDEDFKLVARKGKIKIEKTITVHCIFFSSSVKDWLTIFMWVYFWALCSILLTYLSVLSPIPY